MCSFPVPPSALRCSGPTLLCGVVWEFSQHSLLVHLSILKVELDCLCQGLRGLRVGSQVYPSDLKVHPLDLKVKVDRHCFVERGGVTPPQSPPDHLLVLEIMRGRLCSSLEEGRGEVVVTTVTSVHPLSLLRKDGEVRFLHSHFWIISRS